MAKKRRYKKSKKKASKLALAVVIIIMLSILLGVLIYTKSGIIGIKLHEILGGIFGIMQYILPIGGFAIGIKLATDDRDMMTSKLIQYAIFIISLSVLLSVVQISSGELQSNKELSEVVKDAYYLGEQDKGGGALGAVAAVPLAKLLGDIGAVILCIGIAIVFLVFTFGINMSDIINMFVEKIENKREERLEEKEERNKQEIKETAQERRKREREERMAEKARIKAEKIAKAQNDKELKRIIDKYEITHIIMGNPINLNGSLSDKSKEVLNFVEILKENFNCKVILTDERLTTIEANKILVNTKGKKRKKVIDAVSATIILDSYLDKINKGG